MHVLDGGARVADTMHRWTRLAPVLLAVALGMQSLPARAQVATTGNIRVAVVDEEGLPVPGAVVTAAADDAATTRVAFTDIRGLAELRALNPSAGYEVTVELAGFQTTLQADILVRTGQTASVAVRLQVGSLTETVSVTAAPPVVDVTSAVVAEDITLDLTEAVPTGRSYQSYLQLVPGVLPDDPDSPGNPASKSGLNYRDIGGDSGVSRDNFYYIDGINVTDGVSGTFGANLNTEIIQEQQVLTGGIPAEYVGAPGVLSSVITKSGTNRISGSVNYFFQNDGLVAENRNASDQEFSRFDTALRQQLPPQVQPAVRRPAGRGLLQQAQRGGVRLRRRGWPPQQHRVPEHRRPHARRRAARGPGSRRVS